jgi:hypothetical protein
MTLITCSGEGSSKNKCENLLRGTARLGQSFRWVGGVGMLVGGIPTNCKVREVTLQFGRKSGTLIPIEVSQGNC